MKLFCKNGHEVSEGSKFCPQCGGKIQFNNEKKCLKCGNVLSEEDRFCPECGCPIPPLIPSEISISSFESVPQSPLLSSAKQNTGVHQYVSNPFIKVLLAIAAVILSLFIFFQFKSCTEDAVKPNYDVRIEQEEEQPSIEVEKKLTLKNQIEAYGWTYVGSVSVYNIILDKEVYKSDFKQCLFRKGDQYMLYNSDPQYLDHVTSFYTNYIQRVSTGHFTFKFISGDYEEIMTFNARAGDCVFNI